jgi:hypothetical protein
MDGKDIPVPRELVAQELSHRVLEGPRIGAGARRDDQVHDVPSLAAVQFFPPLLLDKISSLCRVGDVLARLGSDFSIRSLDQLPHTRRAPLNAVAIAPKSEPGTDVLAYLTVAVSLLDDPGCLAIAGQALAKAVAQDDNPANLQFIASLPQDPIDETSIPEARPQDLPYLLVTIDLVRKRRAIDRDMEYADVPAGGPIVEEMFPFRPLRGDCRFAQDLLAALVLDRQFSFSGRVTDHCGGSRAPSIGRQLDHCRLAAVR